MTSVPVGAGVAADADAATRPSLRQVFVAFLAIGSTSLGGAVVAHLRTGLVARRGWLDDVAFVELLSIAQSLPGLNATNMAILVGDRLRGRGGAVLATVAICLPGAALLTAAAFVYGATGDDPLSQAFLRAVAAGAVGLTAAVLVQLGGKVLGGRADIAFAAITAVAVAVVGVPVPLALVGVGAIAIWWHRPRRHEPPGDAEPEP